MEHRTKQKCGYCGSVTEWHFCDEDCYQKYQQANAEQRRSGQPEYNMLTDSPVLEIRKRSAQAQEEAG